MRALNRQQRRASILKFLLLYVITALLIIISFVFLGHFPDQQNEELSEQLETCRAGLKTMSALNSSPVRLETTLKDLHVNYVEIYDSLNAVVRGMVSDLGTRPGNWTEQLIEDFIYKVDNLDRLKLQMKEENKKLGAMLPQ